MKDAINTLNAYSSSLGMKLLNDDKIEIATYPADGNKDAATQLLLHPTPSGYQYHCRPLVWNEKYMPLLQSLWKGGIEIGCRGEWISPKAVVFSGFKSLNILADKGFNFPSSNLYKTSTIKAQYPNLEAVVDDLIKQNIFLEREGSGDDASLYLVQQDSPESPFSKKCSLLASGLKFHGVSYQVMRNGRAEILSEGDKLLRLYEERAEKVQEQKEKIQCKLNERNEKRAALIQKIAGLYEEALEAPSFDRDEFKRMLAEAEVRFAQKHPESETARTPYVERIRMEKIFSSQAHR